MWSPSKIILFWFFLFPSKYHLKINFILFDCSKSVEMILTSLFCPHFTMSSVLFHHIYFILITIRVNDIYFIDGCQIIYKSIAPFWLCSKPLIDTDCSPIFSIMNNFITSIFMPPLFFWGDYFSKSNFSEWE